MSKKDETEVQKNKYGQPARRIADDENPVSLGEEDGSYISENNARQSARLKKSKYKPGISEDELNWKN